MEPLLLHSEVVLNIKPLKTLKAIRAQRVREFSNIQKNRKSRFEHRATPFLRHQIAWLDAVIAVREGVSDKELTGLRLRLRARWVAGVNAGQLAA